MFTVVQTRRKNSDREKYIPRNVLPLYGILLNMPDGTTPLIANRLCHSDIERKKQFLKQVAFTRYQL